MNRLVLGVQPVREAIRVHGQRIERVLLEANASAQLLALERFAQSHGVATEHLARSALDRIAKGVRHQGVIAYAPPLTLHPLEPTLQDPAALLIALDELQDPQNFGAVIRSAVALANAPIVWPEHASAPLTPATFRASAGAIEHATLIRVHSLRSALSVCKQQGAIVVGLDAQAPTPLADIDLTGRSVLVIGSEGQGLRKGVRSLVSVLAHLPMRGAIDSLNASVAVAIALYEAQRQRQKSS